MKKLLITGVLGAIVMVMGLGTQTASAAGFRGGYRGGHVAVRPAYRTAFARPHFVGHGYYGPNYNRCW